MRAETDLQCLFCISDHFNSILPSSNLYFCRWLGTYCFSDFTTRTGLIFSCLYDCSWTRIWIDWYRSRSSRRTRFRRYWRRAIDSSSSSTSDLAREFAPTWNLAAECVAARTATESNRSDTVIGLLQGGPKVRPLFDYWHLQNSPISFVWFLHWLK